MGFDENELRCGSGAEFSIDRWLILIMFSALIFRMKIDIKKPRNLRGGRIVRC